MENIILNETCKIYALCCKNYPFVKLFQNEINALEKVTELHFDVFACLIGGTDDAYFLQFQENGDCFFLNENNGSYSCGVYEARPGICKDYPSKPDQKKV